MWAGPASYPEVFFTSAATGQFVGARTTDSSQLVNFLYFQGSFVAMVQIAVAVLLLLLLLLLLRCRFFRTVVCPCLPAVPIMDRVWDKPGNVTCHPMTAAHRSIASTLPLSPLVRRTMLLL